MSILDDVDPDILICRLAGPLTPNVRPAFREAAEAALAQVSCWGEGAIYRAIAPLQRAYFDPPSDCRAGFDISQRERNTKLKAAPAIEHDIDLRSIRYHKPK